MSSVLLSVYNVIDSPVNRLMIHTSAVQADLNEFFEKKEVWAEPSVPVGQYYCIIASLDIIVSLHL